MRLYHTSLISNNDLTPRQIDQINNEASIATDVGLVYDKLEKQYYGKHGKNKGKIITIMSYEDNPIDLEEKYTKQNKIIPLSTAINAFKELDKLHTGELSKTGIQYLHRDIKLANITENDKGIVTLIDYGFATTKTDIDKEFCGSYLLMSPEIYTDKDNPEYSESSDLYALAKALLINELKIKFTIKYDQMMQAAKKSSNMIEKTKHINDEFNKVLMQLTADELNDHKCIYLNNQTLLDMVLKPKDLRPTFVQIHESLTQQQKPQQQNTLTNENNTIEAQQTTKKTLSINTFYRDARRINSQPLNGSHLLKDKLQKNKLPVSEDNLSRSLSSIHFPKGNSSKSFLGSVNLSNIGDSSEIAVDMTFINTKGTFNINNGGNDTKQEPPSIKSDKKATDQQNSITSIRLTSPEDDSSFEIIKNVSYTEELGVVRYKGSLKIKDNYVNKENTPCLFFTMNGKVNPQDSSIKNQ